MGRHGGGSRSGGGSSSSRSSGGSRSGGSSSRSSRTPFQGCYDRSYYDRRGRFHHYYTSSSNVGTQSGWTGSMIGVFIFITLHMCLMLGVFTFAFFISLGTKVHGDTDRIFVEDRIDILSESEEREIIELFEDVYDASGMPVTLYTDDFTWKEHYHTLEPYSEELYYRISYDEDAMLILFTVETDSDDDFVDWSYDIYCGDDTTKCLSDPEFDKLLANFQKAMSRGDLAEALDYAFDSVMDDIGKTDINLIGIPILLILVVFYSIFYIAIFNQVGRKNAAYKYFQANPDKLSMVPMTLYSACPSCGASNANQESVCRYCGSLLKMREGNITYVRPDDM